MAPPKPTPAQLRDRKARRLAIGLSVVLLGVLGFQGPKILKLVNGSSGTSAVSVASTTAPGSTTAPVSGATGAAPIPGAVVTAAAVPLPTASGTLAHFDQMPAADPFIDRFVVSPSSGSGTTTTTPAEKKTAKQATTTGTTGTTGTTTTTPATGTTPASGTTPTESTSTSTTTTTTTPTTTTPPVPFTTTTTPTATTPATPPNAAVILVNGKREIVPLGGSFPATAPLFKLVKLGGKHPTISIVVLGGSFTNGTPALVIHRGKSLTLANESDGTRYAVKLVELTTADVPTSPTAGAGTTTVSSVPAGTSPTPG